MNQTRTKLVGLRALQWQSSARLFITQRPRHPGTVTAFQRVCLRATPWPRQRVPSSRLIAAAWHSTQTVAPFTSPAVNAAAAAAGVPVTLQPRRTPVSSNTMQYLPRPCTSAGLMPTEARGSYFPEPPYLRETKTYQPAIRVDTTCWQLFRPDINTAHFYFLLQKLCQIT